MTNPPLSTLGHKIRNHLKDHCSVTLSPTSPHVTPT